MTKHDVEVLSDDEGHGGRPNVGSAPSATVPFPTAAKSKARAHGSEAAEEVEPKAVGETPEAVGGPEADELAAATPKSTGASKSKPTPKAGGKVKAKVNASAKKRPASAISSGSPHEEEAGGHAEGDAEGAPAAPAMKRPAAMRRPAAAPGTSALKATKYMYHKDQKWGCKLNGREQLTVGFGSKYSSLVIEVIEILFCFLPLLHFLSKTYTLPVRSSTTPTWTRRSTWRLRTGLI